MNFTYFALSEELQDRLQITIGSLISSVMIKMTRTFSELPSIDLIPIVDGKYRSLLPLVDNEKPRVAGRSRLVRIERVPKNLVMNAVGIDSALEPVRRFRREP